MKNEVIELIRNNKLKNIAINGGDADQAISIIKKIGSKANSDDHAQSALVWELRGEHERSLQSAKKALAAVILERNPNAIPERRSGYASPVEQAMAYDHLLPAIIANVENVYGKGSFESISYDFRNTY
jgi:hypothetical protein